MKKEIRYTCDVCGRHFASLHECAEHEAAHYGLSLPEKIHLDWRRLRYARINFQMKQATSDVMSSYLSAKKDEEEKAIVSFCGEHEIDSETVLNNIDMHNLTDEVYTTDDDEIVRIVDEME